MEKERNQRVHPVYAFYARSYLKLNRIFCIIRKILLNYWTSYKFPKFCNIKFLSSLKDLSRSYFAYCFIVYSIYCDNEL